jgi:peptide subunit release factor 1 (eRF1)
MLSNQRNNMKIEIDIKEIVQKIDINKLVEEKIISDVSEAIDVENIVDEILDDEEVRNQLNKKVNNIIDNYMDSEEGKNRIIDVFNDAITNADILNDDKIIELVAEFLKRKLTVY